LNNIPLITLVALCLHVFIMFQEIATDSLVIDIVPIDEQGRANSLMWGSKTIGTSISLFASSWLIRDFGFSTAVGSMSVTILFIMFVPLLLRERKGEKLFPWSSGRTSPARSLLVVDSWGKLFRSFRREMLLKNSLLLLMTVFVCMAAIHYLRTFLPVFTIQELRWDNMFYSQVYSSANLAGGIVGMLIGGFIILRLGIVPLIQLSLFLLLILVLGVALWVSAWQNQAYITAFVVMFCLLVTMVCIGVLALAMHLCWKRVAAIQFTFCMTIFNAGPASGAALLEFVRPYCTWQMFFVPFMIIVLFAMFMLKYVKTNRHREQVELLEKDYLELLGKEGSLLAKSEPK
jgi:PAT family beta-lactamase induction signal transducer AmpG